MKVADVMTPEVAFCHPEDTLSRAAQLMWERDYGCLPVVDSKNCPVGIITDRDICIAAYSTGQRLADLPVLHAMARRVVSCSAKDSLASAHRSFREYQLHRMPVVDTDGALVGMVSLADIVRSGAAQKSTGKSAAATEVLKTWAAVTRPRSAVSNESKTKTSTRSKKATEKTKVLPSKAPARKTTGKKKTSTKASTRSRSSSKNR